MATKWVRSDDIVWEELHGEALLVSPATGRSWSLNAAAALIWKLCDGRGLSEMARAFATASGCSLRQSRRDILEFCTRVAEQGLLNAVDSGRSQPALSLPEAAFLSGLTAPPMLRPLGLVSGPRRRPSPRGNSGPG